MSGWHGVSAVAGGRMWGPARLGLAGLAVAAILAAGGWLTVSGVIALGVDPLERAGRAYVALATPLNVRLCELGVRSDAAADLPALRTLAVEYAAIHEEFAAGLAAIPFPADFERDTALAVAAVERVAMLNRRASVADGDFTAIGDEIGRALDAQRRVLARLRLRLQLAPLPAAVPDATGRCAFGDG